MALWNRLAESARTVRGRLAAKRNELRGGAFRDASMAMCALVAAADGTIDPAERRRVAQLIEHDHVLRAFPADELRGRFEGWLDRLTTDFDLNRAEALREIAKAARSPAEARAVVRIGIAVGAADGYFDAAELVVVREVCHLLDLPLHEFGL
ncbi:tellurite resistance TerB family protein [Streptomyces nanhaiensis]|uniref:tellurite resistance TerB family protein n=1 Tax=Streptomyces nanhaiensis TaxID=679319 RepID=UPI00399CE3CF